MVLLNLIIIATRRKFSVEYFLNAYFGSVLCAVVCNELLSGLKSLAHKKCRLILEVQRRPEIGVSAVRKLFNLVIVR